MPVNGLPLSHPRQPSIVQLGAVRFRGDGRVEKTLCATILPDGWEVSEEMEDVHGLTTEHCMEFGMPLQTAALRLAGMAEGCLAAVAHNLDFDRRMLVIESHRYGFLNPLDRMKGICTMQLSTDVLRIPWFRGLFKFPSLEEACQGILGREPSAEHDALCDATDCMQIFIELSKRGLAPATI